MTTPRGGTARSSTRESRSRTPPVWFRAPGRTSSARPEASVRRTLVAIVTLVASASGPATALACPNCWLARQVRASVLAAGFWGNLGAVILPVLAVALAAAGLHQLERRASRTPR
jgi:hypothetical protein